MQYSSTVVVLYLACFCLSSSRASLCSRSAYLPKLEKINTGTGFRTIGGGYYYVQAKFSSIEGALLILSSGPSLALLSGPLLITSSHYVCMYVCKHAIYLLLCIYIYIYTHYICV